MRQCFHSPKTWLAALVLLALVGRVGYVLTLEPKIVWFDGQEYQRLARGLLEQGAYLAADGSPTAFWPPGYPAFLALVSADVTGARLLQALLGALTVVVIYQIARRFQGRRASLLASGLCAVYPLYIYTAGALYPVVLLAFLMSLVFLLLLKVAQEGSTSSALLAGMLGAYAGLCAASALPAVLLSIPWIWFERRRRAGPRWRPLVLILLPMIVIIGSWSARNWVHFDRPVLVSLNGGYNLWLGNHPDVEPTTGNRSTPAMKAEYRALSQANPGEATLDRAFTRRALDYVREDPGRFVSLSLRKGLNLWRLYPRPMTTDRPGLKVEKIASIASYGLAMPFALVFLVASVRRRPESRLALIWFLAYTALHAVVLAKFRFRLPLDGILLVFAAGGLAAALKRLGWSWLADSAE